MRVVVVGGGVAGLSCAYYLRKRDYDVTIVESNRIGTGASFANGGWLCPAQAGPLPEPGLTLYGMRTLFDRDSALYFDRRTGTTSRPGCCGSGRTATSATTGTAPRRSRSSGTTCST